MNVLPVTLIFAQVSSNFNAKIVLESSGVEWTIGRGVDRRDLGFSCNALVPQEIKPVTIKSVELTRSMLSINAGSRDSAEPFTFTAALSLPSDIETIEAYCTLNEDARVFARFGCGPLVEFRQGRVSANVPAVDSRFGFITLTVAGLTPGRSIVVEIADREAAGARWSLGPVDRVFTSPFVVESSNRGTIPVGRISLSQYVLEVVTCKNESGGLQTFGDLLIEAYIERLGVKNGVARADSRKIRLCAQCEEDIVVIASVPGKQPQFLAAEPKVLSIV